MLITIRQATSDDLAEITQLFKQTVESVNAKDYSAEQISVWKSGALRTEKWLNKIAGQYFLLAEINNNIAGFGSIADDGYLDFMYVSKDHQGMGVASKIYEELQSFAKRNGFEKIVSDVSITAKTFFERRGFQVVQEQQVTIDGVLLTNYKMQKRLTLP